MKLSYIFEGFQVHRLLVELGPAVEVVFVLKEDDELVVGVDLFFFTGASGVDVGQRFIVDVSSLIFEEEFEFELFVEVEIFSFEFLDVGFVEIYH